MEQHKVGRLVVESIEKAIDNFLVKFPRVNREILDKLVRASYEKGYMICLSIKLNQEPPGDLKHTNWLFNFGRTDIYPSLDEHARLLGPETKEPSPGKPEGVEDDFEKYKEAAEPVGGVKAKTPELEIKDVEVETIKLPKSIIDLRKEELDKEDKDI